MDDVLKEVRRIREEFAASMDYDIHKMAEYLRNKNYVDWPLADRKPQPLAAAPVGEARVADEKAA